MEVRKGAGCGFTTGAAAALRAARLLWVAPALLLHFCRRHTDDALAPPPTQMGARGVERANEVRNRLQLAEAAWSVLLSQYTWRT